MSSLAAAATMGGYRLAGLVLRPLAPLVLRRRARQGKEDPARLGERYGRASRPRPPGRVVWVHAASVGETIAVLPVIERLVAGGFPVVLTTVTVTSASLAAERLPTGAVHQFSPLDMSPYIRRFIDHWRPVAAVFVESEIWPETLHSLAAAGIPRVVVNGRLSPRSFAGWRKHPQVARALFSRIDLCLARSEPDAEHYRALGTPQVAVTGNVKFDSPLLKADPATLEGLRTALRGRPAFVAASTHAGEEEAVGDAHALLRKARPDILTIVVPRHPVRGAAVAAMLAGRGLKVARRSNGEPILPDTDVYVADTLGELGLFYRLAPVAFVGGSLIPHGGQNPIEPLRLGAAVLHGPHVHNFVDPFEAIDGAYPAVVTDAASLAAAVGRLLDDPAGRRAAVDAALAALGPLSGALEATVAALLPRLGRAEAVAEGAIGP